MSINSFGHLFRVTTWGESHGPALGATVDGCPPGIPLDEAAIQTFLDRRKPGQNRGYKQETDPWYGQQVGQESCRAEGIEPGCANRQQDEHDSSLCHQECLPPRQSASTWEENDQQRSYRKE